MTKKKKKKPDHSQSEAVRRGWSYEKILPPNEGRSLLWPSDYDGSSVTDADAGQNTPYEDDFSVAVEPARSRVWLIIDPADGETVEAFATEKLAQEYCDQQNAGKPSYACLGIEPITVRTEAAAA